MKDEEEGGIKGNTLVFYLKLGQEREHPGGLSSCRLPGFAFWMQGKT